MRPLLLPAALPSNRRVCTAAGHARASYPGKALVGAAIGKRQVLAFCRPPRERKLSSSSRFRFTHICFLTTEATSSVTVSGEVPPPPSRDDDGAPTSNLSKKVVQRNFTELDCPASPPSNVRPRSTRRARTQRRPRSRASAPRASAPRARTTMMRSAAAPRARTNIIMGSAAAVLIKRCCSMRGRQRRHIASNTAA